MTIERGDEIKIRSYNSVENEYGENQYNPHFLGWGKRVIYAGVEIRNQNCRKLNVILDDRMFTVDSRNIEHGEHNTYA